MPQIDALPPMTEDPEDDDLLAVHNDSTGDTEKTTFSQIKDYLQGLVDWVTESMIVGFDKSNLTVDSNPYKFRAYSASNQTGVASNTVVQVTLGTENFDTNSNFASSTYTAPVAGFYQFSGAVSFDNSVDGTLQQTYLELYKNNATEVSLVDKSFDPNWGANQLGQNISDLIELASGDTIVLRAAGRVSSGTVTFSSGIGTRLSGYLVSRT